MIRTITISLALLITLPVVAHEVTRTVVVPLGGDSINGLSFHGPQQNLPQKIVEAAGWTVCHSETFGDNGIAILDVKSKCNKSEVMLACRPVGDPIFQLAAHARRSDVFHDTNDDIYTSYPANGSEWYYFPSRSWGFAPIGTEVLKFNCDANATGELGGTPKDQTTDLRMCVLLTGAILRAGYRCGDTRGANLSTFYERVVLHR